MVNDTEKLHSVLSKMSMNVVRRAYIDRVRVETGRTSDAQQWLINAGFEQIDIPAGQLLTDDGREVLMAHGKAWALKPEIHAKRLAEAMEQARKRDAAMAEQQSQPTQPSQPPITCTALIDGQLCGGTLAMAPVCPRCALGKSGVAATLTCDVCGHVTAIMRGDK